MPPAVGLAIAGIASGVGAIAGAKMQSGAAREASRVNADAVKRAQAIEERDHAELLKRNEPYYAASTEAIGRMGDLLRGSRGDYATPVGYTGQPYQDTPRTFGQLRATPDAAPTLVTLEAPNKQIRQVPAAQAAHYIARGARRVG